MSATITVTIEPNLSEALKGLKPEPMRQAIARGMTHGAEAIKSLISEERFLGHGPFPVEEHRLGIGHVHGGRLLASIRVVPARIEGEKVTVSIGSHVEYAAVHEFGWEGDVTVREHERLGHTVKSHERHMNVPERSPFRTGIKEHLDEIQTAIIEEITKGRNQ